MAASDTLAVPSGSAARRRRVPDWAALLIVSVIFVLALQSLRVSAALLLGPVAAGMLLAARSTAVRVPMPAFVFSQAIVGCLIARTMPVSILGEMGHAWPMFVSGVSSVIVLAALLGWIFARWKLLPGTTAVWGSFPGAATAMVLMAESFGADSRLVALMQYLRVLLVGVTATTVARLWAPAHAVATAASAPVAPFHAAAFVATLALAVVAAGVGRRLRVPAGALLVPMFAGLLLQDTAVLRIELPQWLLAGCYALVGWTIGLRFTPAILRHAAALLPRMLAGVVALIAVCGALAAVLAHVAHVDALTAYLAMSPGGADTVAIIASSSPVDVPFVMAMQAARFLCIALFGPALARFVAKKIPG